MRMLPGQVCLLPVQGISRSEGLQASCTLALRAGAHARCTPRHACILTGHLGCASATRYKHPCKQAFVPAVEKQGPLSIYTKHPRQWPAFCIMQHDAAFTCLSVSQLMSIKIHASLDFLGLRMWRTNSVQHIQDSPDDSRASPCAATCPVTQGPHTTQFS